MLQDIKLRKVLDVRNVKNVKKQWMFEITNVKIY